MVELREVAGGAISNSVHHISAELAQISRSLTSRDSVQTLGRLTVATLL